MNTLDQSTKIPVKPKSNAAIINATAKAVLWLFFFCNLGFILAYFPNIPEINIGEIFRLNGFTILIWTTVTFFSAIVSTYSNNYLKGFTYHGKFVGLSFGFTLSVMCLVASNHVAALVSSWFFMGFFMAQLIGVNSNWKEAREAMLFSQKYFLVSTLLLLSGIMLLVLETGSFIISDLTTGLAQVSTISLTLSALLIITAAIIQSALFPFHRWLLSAMTAPTPASALMHAGFVNGAGILLAIFATLIFTSKTLNILFILGGLTAIIAQFTKLLQVSVKQKLACSTIAQMGFMIMQCGLGFFNAAIAHLILHGFYKAYLFLSSGETVEMNQPQHTPEIKINFVQSIVVLIYGIAGAALFIFLTGKGGALNSSIFLTLIVAITVGQMTYNIVKSKTLSLVQKAIVPLALFLGGIMLYASMFNAVNLLMTDMPMVNEPLPLTAIQVVFGVVFLIGFFIMKLGGYRKIPWLYVKLLNTSQPYKKTILTFKQKHS